MLEDLPECSGPVFRVIQPVGVIFKGKGFYVTDHRGGVSPATAPVIDKNDKNDKGEKKATEENKPETNADAKPKAETKDASKRVLRSISSAPPDGPAALPISDHE